MIQCVNSSVGNIEHTSHGKCSRVNHQHLHLEGSMVTCLGNASLCMNPTKAVAIQSRKYWKITHKARQFICSCDFRKYDFIAEFSASVTEFFARNLNTNFCNCLCFLGKRTIEQDDGSSDLSSFGVATFLKVQWFTKQ